MPRCYAGTGTDTNTTNTTISGLTGSSTFRARVFDIIIGAGITTPADNACQYDFTRSTAAGTGGTAITPTALDPNDPAATSTFQSAPTSEPTYTAGAIVLTLSKNMRSTVRWLPLDDMRALIIPATSANGIGARCLTPSTAYAEQVYMVWQE